MRSRSDAEAEALAFEARGLRNGEQGAEHPSPRAVDCDEPEECTCPAGVEACERLAGGDRHDVPAPVLDAMREWLAVHFEDQPLVAAFYRDERTTPAGVGSAITRHHPGGVVAFLRDHGNEGGDDV